MAQLRLSLISRDNLVRLSCRSLTVRVRAATEVIPRWQGLRKQRILLPFGHGHVPFAASTVSSLSKPIQTLQKMPPGKIGSVIKPIVAAQYHALKLSSNSRLRCPESRMIKLFNSFRMGDHTMQVGSSHAAGTWRSRDSSAFPASTLVSGPLPRR